MVNGVRWAGRVFAVLAAFAAAASMATAWVTPSRVIITGADLNLVEMNEPVPLHPLAQFYVYSVAPLVVMALLLATTVGIRGGRARFVAGGIALLASVMTGWGGVGWLPELLSSHPEPWEVRRLRIYATVLITLGLLVAAAAVGLMARKYLMYDAAVVVLLGVLGFYHLAAMGKFAEDRSWLTLTAAAWLCGLALLTAAVAAAVAGTGAAVLRRAAPASFRSPPGSGERARG